MMHTLFPTALRCAVLLALLLLPLFASDAEASELDADAAEALVREAWYEGLPAERARQIGDAGAAHLATLLADPDQAVLHANVLLALGHAGRPGAYEAIEAWADAGGGSGAGRAHFRAWRALPYAWGALAPKDARALARLGALLDAPAPAWSFASLDASELARLRRRAAASALAESGLAVAGAWLDAARTGADAEFAAHLDALAPVHAARRAAREAETSP